MFKGIARGAVVLRVGATARTSWRWSRRKPTSAICSSSKAGQAGATTEAARRSPASTTTLFKQLRLTEPEEVWWTSFDGKRIQGWLLHPPDFDKTKKYPFILEIHGGPHSAYGNTFTHEFQWMAAKGYVVLFPNPRGSSNYGQDFGNVIQYRYPGDDYKDLMAGVDRCSSAATSTRSGWASRAGAAADC